MKKRIRLTEGQLREMVAESVCKILNEARSGRVFDELQKMSDTLEYIIRDSGFIPFSSPSPSSTEVKIARAISEASKQIDNAIYYCRKCGYGDDVTE